MNNISSNQTRSDSRHSPQTLRRVAISSFIGNFVEWFDYAVYGYLAAIIATVFFPESDKTTGLISTFALFAISFIVRPFGGVFWGYVGDRFGRRIALAVSIVVMSGATFCIALLPTYQAVGILAPILLLVIRIIQGFSASGEYAGASAFLAEYAPKDKRGIYTSLVPASTACGLLVGSLLVTGLYAFLSDAQLHSWGWRLPFLLAAPLGLVGRYIRLHLQDSPAFLEMAAEFEETEKEQKVPVIDLLTTYRRQTLIACGVTSLNAVAFYLILSYMPTYLSVEVHLSEHLSFMATVVSLLTYIGFIFIMGKWSDKIGRKKTLSLASILFIVLTIPLFSLLDTESFIQILIIQIIFGAILSMNDGTLPCFLSELFPTHVRYSGFALSFNTMNAICGGTSPLIATWLISVTDNKISPSWYLMFIALIALITISFAKETANKSLKNI
ncbi:MAG: MFS transporter [Gammaproteobacteria bacterium]|nr:MFS transporter [Gammaproteobacteria bacterium]